MFISLALPLIATITQAIIDNQHYTYEGVTIIVSTLIIQGAMVVTALAVKAVSFDIAMDVNTVHEERASSEHCKCVVKYQRL